MPEATCPYCEEKPLGLTPVTWELTPKPGNLLLCLRCEGISAFNEDLELVPPTLEQLDRLM